MQDKTEEMKTVSFSISEDGLEELKKYKKEHNVTPSLMINSIVRHEVNVISKIAEYCEIVIVGVSGKNYLVSIEKLNTLIGITEEAKKTVENYSETIEYNDESFVLVPYDFIFRNFYQGYI